MQPRRERVRPSYRFHRLPEAAPIEPEVRARLGDILPLLAEAAAANRAWLEDFADDPVAISRDLHEVLLAYRALRRAAA